MQLVVNHLTRMQLGFMCVAGIDAQRRHIRPVLGQLMRVDMLAEHGGPFQIGRIVELGETRFAGSMPEIEDRLFEADSVTVVGQMTAEEFWELNASLAAEALANIFGPDLRLKAGAQTVTAAVPETGGLRSLGCYWAQQPRILTRQRGGRECVRFCFSENGQRFDVPVTDIRCYQADHVTPCSQSISTLQDKLRDQPRALTSIGLSRAYRKNPQDPPMHWLQINNIHLPLLFDWRISPEVGEGSFFNHRDPTEHQEG